MDQDKERTLVIVKPDGVQRGLVGEIISRFERRGFKIVGLKLMRITPELAAKHYEAHQGKPFYEPLVAFMTNGPAVMIALQGRDVVRLVRNMMGALNPEDAAPGSIRGDLAISKRYNVIHGSDSPESGAREVGLFFSADEILDYSRDMENWLKHE
ncbi:MAG: nucleoside-diphosphate kinase [bacterium]